MRARRLLLVLALGFSFSAAAKHRGVAVPVRQPIADIFSVSNYAQVTSTHLVLDLTVDFTAQILRGSVTHTLSNPAGAKVLVLDAKDLDIDGATVDGKKANWSFGTLENGVTELIIPIDPKAKSVRIDYRTRATAGALHWLKAKETRNGTMPALWSENEPSLARTWIPLQDTPSVRTTYDATIRVPSGLMALMSATNNPRKVNAGGVYTFSMPHPIPAYLIALTVGLYDFREVGDRTGVYSEPNLIDDTAYEMSFLPGMLSAAERVMGPYPFERYDLVFPPKYPGGMENPELNFIGQDAITGNHPTVLRPNNLVSHEMAHSWFGDLLTCAQWNDLWLNEGFANYFATRIDEEMGATELAEYIYSVDRGALDDYLKLNIPARLQTLHNTFVGSERPSFTVINYQKGEIFLHTLEDRMGRPAFDAFIARYIDNHRFHWVDDVEFRDALLGSAYANPELDLQADAWIYGPGIPSNVSPKPVSSLLTRIGAVADAFRACAAASSIDRSAWTDLEEGLFLSQIQDITVPRMKELDTTFGFSQRKSPPGLWLSAAVKSLDADSRALLDRYLAIGKPSAEAQWYQLSQTEAGRAYAVPLYPKVRDVYDATARSIIAGYLHLTP